MGGEGGSVELLGETLRPASESGAFKYCSESNRSRDLMEFVPGGCGLLVDTIQCCNSGSFPSVVQSFAQSNLNSVSCSRHAEHGNQSEPSLSLQTSTFESADQLPVQAWELLENVTFEPSFELTV